MEQTFKHSPVKNAATLDNKTLKEESSDRRLLGIKD